jgi:hypothetical protein
MLLVGYLMVGAVQSAHDANVTANQRGKAATRRIDGLQRDDRRQGAEIALTSKPAKPPQPHGRKRWRIRCSSSAGSPW